MFDSEQSAETTPLQKGSTRSTTYSATAASSSPEQSRASRGMTPPRVREGLHKKKADKAVASSSSQAAAAASSDRDTRECSHSASDGTRKGSHAAEAAADKHDVTPRVRKRFERTHAEKSGAQIGQRAAEEAENQMACTDSERLRRVCLADMPSVQRTLSLGRQHAKTGINKNNDPNWRPEFEVNEENAQRARVFAKKLQDWLKKKC